MRKETAIFCCYLALFALCCRDAAETGENTNAPESADTASNNRVHIPPTVRSNLGITFVEAQVREVAYTIRVPGQFELMPEARREYRTMASGRVELHVSQYARVATEELLYTLDSPDWRELQQRLNETALMIEHARASAAAMTPLLAAHEEHHNELERAVDVWTRRVQQLEASLASGVVTDQELTQGKGTLASVRADHAEVLEKEAELQLQEARITAELNAHRERFELLLGNASSLLSLPESTLTETDPNSPRGHPRWRRIRKIHVRAEAPGVVESLAVTNGAWADESRNVLTTVQLDQLRFRATGLQADLPKLGGSIDARIAPPRTAGLNITDDVPADVQLGLDAHPDNRTITLIARPAELRSWMRPGVSAFLEIVVESSGGKALAIPRSAIVKDGITHVFFRRDPENPNQAIRVKADMGADDGRWIAIQAGLKRGDEIVLDGAYELMLATADSQTGASGGHAHADGTFHEAH